MPQMSCYQHFVSVIWHYKKIGLSEIQNARCWIYYENWSIVIQINIFRTRVLYANSPFSVISEAPNKTFAHQRHASESELMTTAGVDNSNLRRSVSAMHRDWPETDVDAIETNARRLKTGSLDVKKMNSMDSVQPNHAAFGSHDKIGRTSERPKSQEHGSRTKWVNWPLLAW